MTSVPAGAARSAEGLLHLVQTACARVVGVQPGELVPSTRFARDLGVDSLMLVEIVETVEDRLSQLHGPGHRIRDEELDGFRTVGDLVEHVILLTRARG